MAKLKGPAAAARNIFRLKCNKKQRDVGQPEGNEEFGSVAVEGVPAFGEHSSHEHKQGLVHLPHGGFTDSPPRIPGTTMARSDALPRGKSFSPWIGGDFFICISVKEGIDLFPSVAVRPATCDSFVRVTLQRPASLPLEEAETRVLARNCYPMWEECLPFPLNDMPEDTQINLRVLDKDIGHFNSFLGIVSLPLKDALAAIRTLNQEKIYRLPLLDRQGAVRKRGELVFGVSVVAKHEYREMRTVITAIQDPDQVHDALRDYCLHIKLHGVRELMGVPSSALACLKAEVNVCSTELRRTLAGQLVAGGVDVDDVELVVPLGPAFRDGDTLKGKTRAQFGEVKVELLAGKARLAKTQIPIWDVPFRPEGPATPGGRASGAGRRRPGVRRRSTTGGLGDYSSGSEDEGPSETDSDNELELQPQQPSQQPPQPQQPQQEGPPEGSGLEKKTRLGNIAANIANKVACAALGRCSDTGAHALGLGSAEVPPTPAPTPSPATSKAAPDPASSPLATRVSDVSAVSRQVADCGPGGKAVENGHAAGSPLQHHPPHPPGSANGDAASAASPAPTDSPSAGCGGAGGSLGPLWDGKEYSRRMERLDRNLVRPPVVRLSMQLVKGPACDDSLSRPSGGTTASANGVSDRSSSSASSLDFDAIDVDAPAGPIAAPAPLATHIADFVVAAGPHGIARAAFAEGAELGLRVMATEKMTDLKISPWGPDPDGKALIMRTLSYMKPTVVGPTLVNAQQRLLVKQDGGFVILQYVLPNVPPAGQVVRVELQIVAQHVGPNRTRMTVTLGTTWLKSGMVVNMLKGKVEDATPKDTRKYFETLRRELEAKFGVADESVVVGGDGGAAPAAGLVSNASACGNGFAAPAAAPAAAGAGGWAAPGFPGLVSLVALTMLVLALAGALLRLSGELGTSRRAVEGLAGELRSVTAALEAVARQLAGPGLGAAQVVVNVGEAAAAAAST